MKISKIPEKKINILSIGAVIFVVALRFVELIDVFKACQWILYVILGYFFMILYNSSIDSFSDFLSKRRNYKKEKLRMDLTPAKCEIIRWRKSILDYRSLYKKEMDHDLTFTVRRKVIEVHMDAKGGILIQGFLPFAYELQTMLLSEEGITDVLVWEGVPEFQPA